MPARYLLPPLSLLLLLVGACGVYTFNPKGKSTVSNIAIERFENRTTEFGLADQMTDVVIDALIADGNLKVVSSDNADAVLTGVLVQYERKPYEYDQNDVVESYYIEMEFEIALKNPRAESEIWKEKMSQRGIYQVATETEEDGRQKAIELLVEAIINKTTKSW
ncbi:MAG: LPS assembly lipoprotein LptE [bacterium]